MSLNKFRWEAVPVTSLWQPRLRAFSEKRLKQETTLLYYSCVKPRTGCSFYLVIVFVLDLANGSPSALAWHSFMAGRAVNIALQVLSEKYSKFADSKT